MLFKKITISFIFLFSFSLTRAAEFKTGQTVDYKGNVKEDLYIGAGQISFTGDVNGDANMGGGDIFFKGRVNQDAQFFGGKIQAEISGADDIRIMGGQVFITAKSSGDAFLMGGETNLSPESDIGGDLYIMAGNVVFNGHVKGNVFIRGGNVNLKGGNIDGSLDIQSESATILTQVKGHSKLSARTLIVQPESVFRGAVDYWSEKDVNFHDTVKTNKANFNKELRGVRNDFKWEKKWYLFFLWIPGSALLTVFLSVFLMPALLRESGAKLLSAPASALGYGTLYYLAVPVLVILLFITVIGIVHGFFLCSMYCFSIIFARPLTSAILVAALDQKYGKKWSNWVLVLVGFALYLALSIIFMIPVAGTLFNLLIVVAAMGALVQTVYGRYMDHARKE